MLLRGLLIGAAGLAPLVQGAYVSNVGRQADCEQYGHYPPYLGPCEATNCGAGRLNCLKQVPKMSNCVGYPALGCPYMGCSCSNY
ncbi:hypothetical protein IQ07DRAFT_591760 [Pyrenochaeta sp. DS3sAY3a]|nr:hypothetical protein IQ07DRAFT_591760 [Pyrenochaeta sp. DS3sAY3a]